MTCRALLLLAIVSALAAGACAQDVQVQAQVHLVYPDSQKATPRHSSSNVVFWLAAVPSSAGANADPVVPGHFRMEQRNKSFNPHLLVVPLGSTVDFPNLDPFFHNVFSQFNGKRFDLGLYEAGSVKGVRFDHEGVSFIFCNIHPEMGAVIVTLATPYYAVSTGSGALTVHNVPPGIYELHLWAEGADTKALESLTRVVHISASQSDLGSFQIPANNRAAPHLNKFGNDYPPDRPSEY
jgi:plastocyanin